MKNIRTLCAIACVGLIAACSPMKGSNELDALNKAEAVGSPFTKYLAAEYRDYANNQQYEVFDYADAVHFARKGLAAASGEFVMPESLDDWDLSSQNLVELGDARSQLIRALEGGAREQASQQAAVAQARFDCWVESQEENWQATITDCKNQFWDAMNAIKGFMAPPPAPPAAEQFPAPITDNNLPKETVPLAEAAFIVFFDWDRSDVTAGAGDVLDAVAKEVKGRNDVKTITIVGHADTSGSDSYNQRLSDRRAKAVKDGLVARGMSSDIIVTEARGESEPMVATADDVREPANRRAQITLQ